MKEVLSPKSLRTATLKVELNGNNVACGILSSCDAPLGSSVAISLKVCNCFWQNGSRREEVVRKEGEIQMFSLSSLQFILLHWNMTLQSVSSWDDIYLEFVFLLLPLQLLALKSQHKEHVYFYLIMALDSFICVRLENHFPHFIYISKAKLTLK